MKRLILFTSVLLSATLALAQSPTVVTNAVNCFPFRNFNTTNEGFSSPSIYSGNDDAAFDWSSTAGAELETSGLSVRSSSLISPVYIQSGGGNISIGFRYIAPPGSDYRIRIITGVIGSPLEVLASTSNGPVYTPFPSTSGNICLLLTDADLVLGRPVRFEFVYRMSQPGDALFDDLALSIAGIPLPVTFEGFVARKNTDGSLKLLWNVSEEVNVKGYYVETSTNGTNFTSAGYVTANGKSVYAMDYTAQLKQTTFFRVRNIDFDGNSKLTPVIRVYAKESADAGIQIYPMPATDMVTVQHNQSPVNAMLTVYTLDGRLLQQVSAGAFTVQTQLDIHKLAKGIYIVRYDEGGGNVKTAKLVKN